MLTLILTIREKVKKIREIDPNLLKYMANVFGSNSQTHIVTFQTAYYDPTNFLTFFLLCYPQD